ncbi:MAG: hypothetical protein FWD77_08260, partial [Betaproteobacteria bacterium]|nr:hypothetical protein [Betaproteobacteria bacterium]
MSFGIQADSGYAIDKIMDGSTDVTGTQAGMTTGSYALTGISANHTLVVSFVLQLSLTPSSLPNGTVGTAYSVSIAGDASGGVPPYAGFSLAAGSTLP